ncbi:MAG TPA: hypothetical protein EYO73_08980 [Sulfurimonas sp.]|nr:hypothetical protein [Sulfurimonas sp.]
MSKKQDKPLRIPFSIGRFLASSIGHFLLFSSIIGMLYLADPSMLEYGFLFTASGIAAFMLGIYHSLYKREED